MADHFPLKLTGSRMLAPSVRHLEFVRDDAQALDFIAGQFIEATFPGVDEPRRFSMANPPASAEQILHTLLTQAGGAK